MSPASDTIKDQDQTGTTICLEGAASAAPGASAEPPRPPSSVALAVRHWGPARSEHGEHGEHGAAARTRAQSRAAERRSPVAGRGATDDGGRGERVSPPRSTGGPERVAGKSPPLDLLAVQRVGPVWSDGRRTGMADGHEAEALRVRAERRWLGGNGPITRYPLGVREAKGPDGGGLPLRTSAKWLESGSQDAVVPVVAPVRARVSLGTTDWDEEPPRWITPVAVDGGSRVRWESDTVDGQVIAEPVWSDVMGGDLYRRVMGCLSQGDAWRYDSDKDDYPLFVPGGVDGELVAVQSATVSPRAAGGWVVAWLVEGVAFVRLTRSPKEWRVEVQAKARVLYSRGWIAWCDDVLCPLGDLLGVDGRWRVMGMELNRDLGGVAESVAAAWDQAAADSRTARDSKRTAYLKRGDTQSVQVGSRASNRSSLCIYDKTQQIEEARGGDDGCYREAWLSAGWDGEENIQRVEVRTGCRDLDAEVAGHEKGVLRDPWAWTDGLVAAMWSRLIRPFEVRVVSPDRALQYRRHCRPTRLWFAIGFAGSEPLDARQARQRRAEFGDACGTLARYREQVEEGLVGMAGAMGVRLDSDGDLREITSTVRVDRVLEAADRRRVVRRPLMGSAWEQEQDRWAGEVGVSGVVRGMLAHHGDPVGSTIWIERHKIIGHGFDAEWLPVFAEADGSSFPVDSLVACL